MGEAKQRAAAAVQEARVALGVEAIGGRVQVRWNQREAATPFGQMAYFIEFVHLTGVYQRWIESCPLHLASPNGSKMADILGTLFFVGARRAQALCAHCSATSRRRQCSATGDGQRSVRGHVYSHGHVPR